MRRDGLEAEWSSPSLRKRQGLFTIAACSLIACGAPSPAKTTATPQVPSSGSPPGFPIPPDTRPQGCDGQTDPEGRDFEDMKVSIIIPYRNEAWKHIKGSVASILWYTPARYIAEIMFVADGNGPEALFADKIRNLSPLVTMLVLPSAGVGLITAKIRAVSAAAPEASVLVFLEPHIRVNRHWLEPLLVRIRKYPQVLAMPALDAIPQDDFNAYLPSVNGHWRFEWNLNLVYTNPSDNSQSSNKPFHTPATSGGIFAIGKDWWNKLGFYDSGMVGWGGDHVEATMKVWRCGGHIDIIPCSRIGHMFRDPEKRPYSVEVDQVVRNYARAAHIWFDEQIEFFFKMKPEAHGMDVGDISKAKEQRHRLQCKNMSWFLDNVDPEMKWESDKICIPGCSREELGSICCSGDAAPQRSTIDRTMPRELFRPVHLPTILQQHKETLEGSDVGKGTKQHSEL